MPPKPTCKVVKREGQRGARIDPRGCKVRTTKDAQGNKKKETKQGNEKIKRTTTKRDMRLAVAGVSAIGTTATSRLLVRINSINWVDVGVFYGPGASRGPMAR